MRIILSLFLVAGLMAQEKKRITIMTTTTNIQKHRQRMSMVSPGLIFASF